MKKLLIAGVLSALLSGCVIAPPNGVYVQPAVVVEPVWIDGYWWHIDRYGNYYRTDPMFKFRRVYRH